MSKGKADSKTNARQVCRGAGRRGRRLSERATMTGVIDEL